MSETSSLYSNIFKSSNNNMRYLNKLHSDIYYDEYDDNISKTFLQKSKFDWEVYISLMFNKLDIDIIPNIININYNNNNISSITYDTSSLISLRKVFETNNSHYIINELLSFLKTIRNKNILIGNLHIDTIYVDINKDKCVKFYILDISNTTFTQLLNNDLDLQSLYISLYDNCINNKVIKYFEKEINIVNLLKNSLVNNIINLYN